MLKMKSRLKMLSEWRKVVKIAKEIINELYPDAEIYLIGGAAENRLTIYSDNDLLVVLGKGVDRVEALTRIWDKLFEKFSLYYPLEIHIVTKDEFLKFKGKKIKL